MSPQAWYWVGLVIYVAAVAYITYKAAQATHTSEDFYVGGRSLGIFVVAMTYAASSVSGSTFVGIPGVAYRFGYGVYHLYGSSTIGMVLGWWFVARMYREAAERTNALTLPDIMAKRFNSNFVRLLGALVIIVGTFFIMVAQYKAVGIIFSELFGMSFNTAVILFAIIVAVYLAVGGFLAVAWTDTLQGCIMIVGMLLIVFIGLGQVGGFEGLNAKVGEAKPEMLQVFGWLSGYGLIGGALLLIAFNMSVPYVSVRFITYRKGPNAELKAGILSTIANMIFSLAIIAGMLAFVLLPGLTEFDKAMPLLILHLLHPLVAAILLAATVAAIMSTVDSGLIIVGQSFARDIYQKLIAGEEEVSDARLLVLSRIIVVVVVIVSAISSMWAPPEFLTLFLLFGAGFMAVTFFLSLTLGLWWKRMNSYGAMAGILIPLVIYVGNKMFGFGASGFKLFAVSIFWGLIGAVLLSLLTPAQPREELEAVFGRGV